MTNQRGTIVLVGGGRWGRVHASNIAQLLSPKDRVLWISHYNQDEARELIKKLPNNAPHFELSGSLTEALQKRPTAALVTNRSSEHFKTVRACLLSGVNTFVEKPLCLRLDEAQTLVDLAKREQRVLAVGLHLLSTSYLLHFKELLAKRTVSRIRVQWCDPGVEVRYGEEKRADHSSPLAHDLFPHFWSIIYVLTDTASIDIVNASRSASEAVSLRARAGEIECEALFHRRANARRRRIEVSFEDGGTATIDFTQEPGAIICDGIALPTDPAWGKSVRPLMREVQMFLEHVARGLHKGDWAQLAANCIESVAGAEKMHVELAGP